MNSIGVLLDNLGPHQVAYEAITNVNDSVRSGSLNDYLLFYSEQTHPVIRPLVSYMNMSEAFSFPGIIVSTSIKHTPTILKSFTAKKKVLYLHDLDWIRDKAPDYLHNVRLLHHRELSVICRSKSYTQLLSNYCNRQADFILEQLDPDAILSAVSNEETTP